MLGTFYVLRYLLSTVLTEVNKAKPSPILSSLCSGISSGKISALEVGRLKLTYCFHPVTILF